MNVPRISEALERRSCHPNIIEMSTTSQPSNWFETVGQAFVKIYYETFDSNRANLAALYTPSSMMTFEGNQVQGGEAIMAKLMSLPFQNVAHVLTVVDCQPTSQQGIIVFVLGQLKTDNDRPHTFNQTFHLVPSGNQSYCVHNDIFRLALHNN